MTTERTLRVSWLLIAMLVAGCSSQPGPADSSPPLETGETRVVPEVRPQPETSPASTTERERPATVQDPPGSVIPGQPRPRQAVLPVIKPAPSEPAQSPPSPGAAALPPPSQQPEPMAVNAPEPGPVTTEPRRTPPVVDVGGPVEVAATKPGRSRVGSDKCELCHKVQFASWAESAHALRTPPLDCESCHGPGSEYKSLAVMKNPEKARSAGLVIPDGWFCAKCHTAGWTDDLLKRAHAHKDGPS